jgi:hypothetical protein
LGYIDANPDNNLMLEYFAAIDGIAVEELFYNKTLTADQYRLNILRQLKNHVKKIIVPNMYPIKNKYLMLLKKIPAKVLYVLSEQKTIIITIKFLTSFIMKTPKT